MNFFRHRGNSDTIDSLVMDATKPKLAAKEKNTEVLSEKLQHLWK